MVAFRDERRRKARYANPRIITTAAIEPITTPAIAPPDKLLEEPVAAVVVDDAAEDELVNDEVVEALVDGVAAREESDIASKAKVVALGFADESEKNVSSRSCWLTVPTVS